MQWIQSTDELLRVRIALYPPRAGASHGTLVSVLDCTSRAATKLAQVVLHVKLLRGEEASLRPLATRNSRSKHATMQVAPTRHGFTDGRATSSGEPNASRQVDNIAVKHMRRLPSTVLHANREFFHAVERTSNA